MTVSSVSSSSASPNFLTRLESKGLSSDKADLVGGDLVTAVQQVADANGGVATDDKVRDVLDKRIADDVASGKLSKDDAAAVAKTLDQMEGVADDGADDDTDGAGGAAPAAGAPASGGPQGVGGGGETKTELSRITTVAGSVKTTVVTYTDGTSETTTGVATPTDQDRYGKKTVADDATSDGARSYLSTIEPGTLIDKTA